LYIGRFFGLGLFIVLATYVSELFALKYSLIIVAGIQVLSIPLAIHIAKQTTKYENNEPAELQVDLAQTVK